MNAGLLNRFPAARHLAWFAGLMVLSLAILVIEAPKGFEEPGALSVRPYAESPVMTGDKQARRAPARAAQADKPLDPRPTIRT